MSKDSDIANSAVDALAKQLNLDDPQTLLDVHNIIMEHITAATRPRFKARPMVGKPWLYEVWDISHPNDHFPVLTINSKGASDDFHQKYAEICARALNFEYGR